MRVTARSRSNFFKFVGIAALVCGFYLVINVHNNSSASQRYDAIPGTSTITSGNTGVIEVWGKYADGYGLVDTLSFSKKVSPKILYLDEELSSIVIVKKYGYEVNLDELTIDGVAPTGYEKKLIYTDNDLIEIEDKAEFNISGSGKLVISARAPATIAGEEYAFHFPSDQSQYYDYALGQNSGSFDISVPESKYLFHEEMVYPGSGHPDAPISWYVADDEDNLYVYAEVFGDNTFDHGKDYAKVYIKQGNSIKNYSVHTVEDNVYGRWAFEYTNTKPEYHWQHMLYLIKVPKTDLVADNLQLAFEYYGTLSCDYTEYIKFRKVDDEGNPIANTAFGFNLYEEIIDTNLEPENTDDEGNVYTDSDGYVYFIASYSHLDASSVLSYEYRRALMETNYTVPAVDDGNLMSYEEAVERIQNQKDGCSSTHCYGYFSVTGQKSETVNYLYNYYLSVNNYSRYFTAYYYEFNGSYYSARKVRYYRWNFDLQKWEHTEESGALEYYGINNWDTAIFQVGKFKLVETSAPEEYIKDDGYLAWSGSFEDSYSENCDDYYIGCARYYTFSDVTNRRNTFDLAGAINWLDNNDAAKRRPLMAKIHLYRNGIEIASTDAAMDEESQLWHFSFANLLHLDSNGNEYKYTIAQDEVNGYISEIDGFNITNKYTPSESSSLVTTNPKTGEINIIVYAGAMLIPLVVTRLIARRSRR